MVNVKSFLIISDDDTLTHALGSYLGNGSLDELFHKTKIACHGGIASIAQGHAGLQMFSPNYVFIVFSPDVYDKARNFLEECQRSMSIDHIYGIRTAGCDLISLGLGKQVITPKRSNGSIDTDDLASKIMERLKQSVMPASCTQTDSDPSGKEPIPYNPPRSGASPRVYAHP